MPALRPARLRTPPPSPAVLRNQETTQGDLAARSGLQKWTLIANVNKTSLAIIPLDTSFLELLCQPDGAVAKEKNLSGADIASSDNTGKAGIRSKRGIRLQRVN